MASLGSCKRCGGPLAVVSVLRDGADGVWVSGVACGSCRLPVPDHAHMDEIRAAQEAERLLRAEAARRPPTQTPGLGQDYFDAGPLHLIARRCDELQRGHDDLSRRLQAIEEAQREREGEAPRKRRA